jgi:hypothetical protein
MPNGVHTSVHPMKPLRPEPRRDGPPPEPERPQLAPGNHAVLPLRELGDRLIGRPLPTNRLLCTYVMHNSRFVRHDRILAASV